MPKVPDIKFPNLAPPETKQVKDDFLILASDHSPKLKGYLRNMEAKRKAKKK